MHDYTSKQLFMANGGEKLYIFKDGFGDVYSATPEEEREWTSELIAQSLKVISDSDNSSRLETAIETLMYHVHPGVEILLLNKVLLSQPLKAIVFAAALWRFFRITDSFGMILKIYTADPANTADAVFDALRWFEAHPLARPFLEDARAGSDTVLSQKASAALGSWPVHDLPATIYHHRNHDSK